MLEQLVTYVEFDVTHGAYDIKIQQNNYWFKELVIHPKEVVLVLVIFIREVLRDVYNIKHMTLSIN